MYDSFNLLHSTIKRVVEVLHDSVSIPGNCYHAAQTCNTENMSLNHSKPTNSFNKNSNFIWQNVGVADLRLPSSVCLFYCVTKDLVQPRQSKQQTNHVDYQHRTTQLHKCHFTHRRGCLGSLRWWRSWPWIVRKPSQSWCTLVRAERRRDSRRRAAERWSWERDTPARNLHTWTKCKHLHYEQFRQHINKSAAEKSVLDFMQIKTASAALFIENNKTDEFAWK